MPTRFNSFSSSRFGVPGIPSGYGGKSQANLSIPPVGFEDVDVALFNLFDHEIPFEVSNQTTKLRKVPVVFASGEKWAVLKNGRGLHDKNNTLILPLITIGRTTIKQSPVDDIVGRGINQQTGEIIIKRRLDSRDRGYQNLINRALIPNQLGLAVNPAQAIDGQMMTLREVGDLANDPTVEGGGLLAAGRDNNIFETLTIPAPQFYTAVYEVMFWTQYTQHMNQLLEQMISSFLPQAQSWKLNTLKGYWFIATIDDNVYNAESNFDEMGGQERIIKYKFTIRVPAYVLTSASPGSPVPIKRYVSAPTVDFVTEIANTTSCGSTMGDDVVNDPFLGADDPTLPIGSNKRKDARLTGTTRLFPKNGDISPGDPALKSMPRGTKPALYKKVSVVTPTGKHVTRYARIKKINRATGETVFSCIENLGGNDSFVENPFGEGFFVIDQNGDFVIDNAGNPVTFL